MTFGRFLLVMFAGFAACFAAGVLLTLAALKPEWSGLFVDAFGEGSLRYIIAFGGLFASLAAFLPTVAIIVIGEVLRLRSVIYYGFAFAAMTVFTYFYVSDWSMLAINVDGFRRRELELMAAAGIVAGFVYWAIAGRTAGGERFSSTAQITDERQTRP